VMIVDANTFRGLALEAARRHGLPPAGTVVQTIQFADLRYPSICQALRSAGLSARPLKPLHEQPIVPYEVRPRGPAQECDAGDLTTALEMARPTFVAAVPLVQTAVEVGGKGLTLAASTPADLRRFRAGVRHGHWLSGPRSELVLPVEAVRS